MKYLIIIILFISINVYSHENLHLKTMLIHDLDTINTEIGKLYINKGNWYRKNKQWRKALKSFKHAKKNGVDPSLVNYQKASVYRDMGKTKKAIRYLNATIKNTLNPTTIGMASIILAEIYKSKSSWLLSAKYYQRAIENFNNMNPTLYISCISAYQKAGEKYYDNAMTIIKKGISLGPNIFRFYEIAIEIENDRKNYKQANKWNEKFNSIQLKFRLNQARLNQARIK